MYHDLIHKNILVTAGPTWVPIDAVRVITNVFGGTLGVLIAEKLSQAGAIVTLLYGPGRAVLPKESSNLKIARYKYYAELMELMTKTLDLRAFDCVVHSAAVADYAPEIVYHGKIASKQTSLQINLKPTVKIVDLIKSINPDIFLVKFKLEVGCSTDNLLNIAKKSMQESHADLMVANEFSETGKKHRAYIIEGDGIIHEIVGKEKIAETITDMLEDKL